MVPGPYRHPRGVFWLEGTLLASCGVKGFTQGAEGSTQGSEGSAQEGDQERQPPPHPKTDEGQVLSPSGSSTSNQCQGLLGPQVPGIETQVPGAGSFPPQAIPGHLGLQTGLPLPPSPEAGEDWGPRVLETSNSECLENIL